MIIKTKETDLMDALVRLQADPNDMPWRERLEVAKLLTESIDEGQMDEVIFALIHVLACDSKWEVRCVVAELLLALPDHDFGQLASQLSSDSNSYVSQAAERAFSRRRQIAKRNGRTRQTVDEITRQLETMEERHGRRTAQTTMRICDRYMQVVVGAIRVTMATSRFSPHQRWLV